MKTRMKEYWSKLKAEYENKYKENIFKNYEQTVPVFKEFRDFLNELKSKYPTNVNIICILASVELELGYQKTAIKLLEDFISKYKDLISNID